MSASTVFLPIKFVKTFIGSLCFDFISTMILFSFVVIAFIIKDSHSNGVIAGVSIPFGIMFFISVLFSRYYTWKKIVEPTSYVDNSMSAAFSTVSITDDAEHDHK
jgi:hypothetical protein